MFCLVCVNFLKKNTPTIPRVIFNCLCWESRTMPPALFLSLIVPFRNLENVHINIYPTYQQQANRNIYDTQYQCLVDARIVVIFKLTAAPYPINFQIAWIVVIRRRSGDESVRVGKNDNVREFSTRESASLQSLY